MKKIIYLLLIVFSLLIPPAFASEVVVGLGDIALSDPVESEIAVTSALIDSDPVMIPLMSYQKSTTIEHEENQVIAAKNDYLVKHGNTNPACVSCYASNMRQPDNPGI